MAEHAFQGKKIEILDKEEAHRFCKNSGDIIGITTDGVIAKKKWKITNIK